MFRLTRLVALAGLILLPDLARADDLLGSGKLLATGGVSTLEGPGGGGLVPWALISGYGTRDQIGGNAHYGFISLPDFQIQSGGFSVGLFDRVELSYAHLSFETGDTGAALGLGKNFSLQEDVVGAKVKLAGDAVFEQDRWLPQLALGLEYKATDHGNVLKAIGAKGGDGVDVYLAATKLLLDESLLLNATIIGTRANELGILGFNDSYKPAVGGSVGYLLSREVLVGAEFRTQPSNLAFTRQDDWKDIFVAWFPTKNASLTLGYIDLGTIATRPDQHGFYLSAQLGW